MSDNERDNKELEELSRAITKALLKSKDVLSILFDLKKRNMIEQSAMLALIIKVNDFINTAERSLGDGSNGLKLNTEHIDGKILSKNEAAFEEYLSEKFDETEWLKKYGIILN
jgi:hypothetical protein